MPYRVCFGCCFHDNRIHPLENMVNFMELSLDEEEHEVEDDDQEESVRLGTVKVIVRLKLKLVRKKTIG